MNEFELYKNYPYAELTSESSSAKLRIYVLSYENPNEAWYENFIYLSINGMSVKTQDPAIHADELVKFLSDLRKLEPNQNIEIASPFIEPTLSLEFSRIKNEDAINVKGGIINSIHRNKSRAYIQFEFFITPKELTNFIKGMENILNKYPPR